MLAAGLDEARQTTAELGIELVPLVDLSLADLRARLRALPADSVVISVGFWHDDPRAMSLVPAAVLETLCQETTAPVFGVLNTYLGRGVVGGVCIDAHELGQPLGAILNNLKAAEMLLREVSSQHAAELREILRDIAAADRRAGGVLDRIRAMVRRQPFRLTAVDVAELFRGAIERANRPRQPRAASAAAAGPGTAAGRVAQRPPVADAAGRGQGHAEPGDGRGLRDT